jgi:abortive infection bacteriophage resistance protein
MDDTQRVANYLNHIGYFRLTGYFKYFQDTDTNQFYDDISFDKVLDLYIFDRKLRLLMLDAIEKIEVSIKAQIEEIMSNKYGCFRYTEKEHFALGTPNEAVKHDRFMEKAKETKEQSTLTFVQAYNEKYTEEEFLPSRMVMESCTIGGVSRIFSLINGGDAKEIAKTYNTYYVDLRKWLQLVVNVRNISAHQERLWNRKFITKPRVNDVIFKEKYQLQEIE